MAEPIQSVAVPAAGVVLDAEFGLPARARGVVLFAHGSGSGRRSPRNQRVAAALRDGGLGTMLIDLLTPEEEDVDLRTAHLRFDLGLLAGRLVGVTDWLRSTPETGHLHIGYFGASTGGGAALIAAAERPGEAGAVVSRGGRPDLAGDDALAKVKAPTLLIVGSADPEVLRLNHAAFDKIRAEKRLEIIPGATHLFEEPGALERVAELAREWFQLHLVGRTMPAGSH